MNTRVILTVLGTDRPGLTRALADAVMASDGNWLESQLARLGGQYVGAVLVDLPQAQVESLRAGIEAIAASGLAITIVPAGEEPEPARRFLGIEIVGQDRPGIVREVTGALAALGANIEEFSSSTENSAWSGEPLFKARARTTIPDALTVDAVREGLEAISSEIMVDFSFRKSDGQGR
ncbi:MAG TPA: ACT domain-containing protein [Novosphingobium sp.]|nr:ACT domain-containing protein [Novosphingobium sp.]